MLYRLVNIVTLDVLDADKMTPDEAERLNHMLQDEPLEWQMV